MTDLSTLTHERFEACDGQTFIAADAGAEPVALVLSEVRLQGTFDPEHHQRQAFSLLFSGRTETVLEQRMYLLQNDTLGELTIFLVPIGSDGDRMLYEAVFT